MSETEPQEDKTKSETHSRLGADAVRFSPSPDDETYEITGEGNYPGDGPPLLTGEQPSISNLLPSIFKKPEE